MLALPSASAPGSATAWSSRPWPYLTSAPGGEKNQACSKNQTTLLGKDMHLAPNEEDVHPPLQKRLSIKTREKKKNEIFPLLRGK